MCENYLSHDSVYQKKDDWSEGNYDFERDWDWFIENSTLPKDISILELGCGAAPYLNYFLLMSKKYLGIDISPNAINKAKKRNNNNSNNKFLCLNFVSDWQNNDEFDLILDSFFLHCIIGNDRKITVHKIANSLKTGGEFWINTMCNPPKLSEMLKSYNSETKCMELEKDSTFISVRQFDSPKTIREMIEFCGLKLVKEKILFDESQDNYIAIFRK